MSTKSEAPRRSSEFYPFRACCCLLLAAAAVAKPGRSTLDTKKGYKTKTGSTSSVTLALTLALGGKGSLCPPPPKHPKSPHLDPPPTTPNCPTWTPPPTDPPGAPPPQPLLYPPPLRPP